MILIFNDFPNCLLFRQFLFGANTKKIIKMRLTIEIIDRLDNKNTKHSDVFFWSFFPQRSVLFLRLLSTRAIITAPLDSCYVYEYKSVRGDRSFCPLLLLINDATKLTRGHILFFEDKIKILRLVLFNSWVNEKCPEGRTRNFNFRIICFCRLHL